MEQFANIPNTTLNGTINNSVTTLVVTSGSSFPASGIFRILIDDEILAVTAISGTTWTISRANGGSTAASHNNGVQIYGIVTKEALDSIVTIKSGGTEIGSRRILNFTGVTVADDPTNHKIDITASPAQTNTLANLPVAGTAGRIYFPSDSPTAILIDNGSIWVPYGPIYCLTPPIDANFSWINQGSADLVVTPYSITMRDYRTSGSGDNFRMRIMSMPSTPYTITAAFQYIYGGNANGWYGLIFRNSSTGSLQHFGMFVRNTDRNYISSYNYNSSYSWQSTLFDFNQAPPENARFLRLTDDGSTWTYSSSCDGIHFVKQGSQSRLSGYNQIGWFMSMPAVTPGSTNATGSALKCIHWLQG